MESGRGEEACFWRVAMGDGRWEIRDGIHDRIGWDYTSFVRGTGWEFEEGLPGGGGEVSEGKFPRGKF